MGLPALELGVRDSALCVSVGGGGGGVRLPRGSVWGGVRLGFCTLLSLVRFSLIFCVCFPLPLCADGVVS